MKTPLLTLLLIAPFALPLTARHKPVKKKKPTPAASSPARPEPVKPLKSDPGLNPATLPESVIIGCIQAGKKTHAPAAETVAAVKRPVAPNDFGLAPRSVQLKVNFAVPDATSPTLAFLSDKTEANLCLLGKKAGKTVILARGDETVEAGDPVNAKFATWLEGGAPGEKYFLLDTRKIDGASAEYECLRLYSLDADGKTLKLNDTACEQAGSWSVTKQPDGGVAYKGSDFVPNLREWNAQCIVKDGQGVPNPEGEHRTLGELTPEVFCADKPARTDYYYNIEEGKLHIYKTVTPPAGE
jgi:hypothetical protein